MKTKHVIWMLFLMILMASCSATRKNPYYQKKKNEVIAPQLGRSRYFYSKEYQKKLTGSLIKKTPIK